MSRPERGTLRHPTYDYRTAGAYFVTFVTHDRLCIFDDPVLKRVAETYWERIPLHSEFVTLDEWVVMPNHIHTILWILHHLGNSPVPQTDAQTSGPASGSVSAIVGAYKAVTARRINQIRKLPDAPVWQRSFHDRIIRNDRELVAIRQYIQDNPRNWAADRENLS